MLARYAAPVLGFILIAGSALGNSYDVLIKNGRIIDGTGAAWYRGDIGVREGRIAWIGNDDGNATATQVIDAGDHYVAPGFIDVHTHCERDLPGEPAENFIRMGVTTVITGNCGGSYLDMGSAFTSHTVERTGVNVASLVGHNTVRRSVMGNEDRDPTTTESLEMARLVDQAMQDGAIGISTGLIYNPGKFSKTPEIVDLAKVVSKHNGIYVSHMRSEAGKVEEAIEEALTIGREADLPVHISHFKISSPKKHGESTITLGMVEKAREQGQDVTVDQYAYTASSTGINTMLPDEVTEGSSEEIRARMATPEQRKAISDKMVSSYLETGRKDLSHAVIASFRPDPSINGMSIPEIAKKWKNSDSWEAQTNVVMDIVTSGGAGMVFHSMDELDVQNIMSNPFSMVASDSGVRTFGSGIPHPRGYGNNARVLGRYARDLKLISIEEAIRKMTSLPARTMRLFDRGIIRPGGAADIVVFDLEKVNDPATFAKPHAYAEGFTHVLVNGTAVIDDGELTGFLPGKVLKRGHGAFQH